MGTLAFDQSTLIMALLWTALTLLVVAVNCEPHGPATVQDEKAPEIVQIEPRNETEYTAGSCIPDYGVHYYCHDCSPDSRYYYKVIKPVCSWEKCGENCFIEGRACTHWSWWHGNKECRLHDNRHNDKGTSKYLSGKYNCFTYKPVC